MGMNLWANLGTDAGPDFGALGNATALKEVVGALMTYGLVVSALMVIICAAAWAIGSANGSWQAASKGKVGLFVALGGAVLTGGSLAWANWLIDIGATL